MIRLGGTLLLIALPTSALAAGGMEDAPAWFRICLALGLALLFGLPSVGLGYFLQSLMRFRTAVILLASAALAFWLWLASVYGLEKTLGASSLFLVMMLFFSPLFGLGWYIGTRETKRNATRQQFA